MEQFIGQNILMVLGSVVVFMALASFILTSQYGKIIEKLDGLDHPTDGYVSKTQCKELQSACAGTQHKCSERIEKALERIEREIRANRLAIFWIADRMGDSVSKTDLFELRKIVEGESVNR